MRTARHSGTHQRGRASFTLVELLVVIMILAVLMALTAGAVMKFLGSRPRAETVTSVKKFHDTFKKRWMEATDVAKQQAKAIPSNYRTTIETMASTPSGNDPDRVIVIWVKIRQKQWFPQTYVEALSPINLGGGVTIPAPPGYVEHLKKYGITSANASTVADGADVQAAVCLMMAIMRSPAGGQMTEQDVGSTSNIGTKLSTGNAPYLTDNWGNPLVFSRWPLGYANGTAADPSDPQGKLKDPLWVWQQQANGRPIPGRLSTSAAAFEAAVHAVHQNRNQLTSGILTPILASSGADAKVGLFLVAPATDPTDNGQHNPGKANHWATSTATDTNDNIYSNDLPQ